MSDDLKGQNIPEETGEPMPSSEKSVEDNQESSLPDQVSERTAEEFEKLKAHNASLKAQLEAANSSSYYPSMLDGSQTNQGIVPEGSVPAASSTTSNENFIDDGGYVDTTLLNSKLSKAETEAKEAKLAVQQMQRERQEEAKLKTWSEFPELAYGTDHFDPDFDKRVKLELTRQLIEEGKQNYLSAAKEVRRLFPAKVVEDNKTISSREQASAQTGTSKGSDEPINQSELVAGTMKGDAEAIYKRLQASGN